MSQPVVVCGAGIVGMASVLALARAGIRTQLVAPRPAMPGQPVADRPYHPRVYAISPASQQFLSELGVWDALDHARIAAVTTMEIEGDGGARLHLDAWHAARSHLAWIVESGEIERVMTQVLAWSGAPWIDDSVAQWRTGEVVTARGQTIACELCIGADGAASPLRTMAGLSHQATPYGDVGLVAHLDCTLPHQNTACQWFTEDGVLALLPLPDTARGHQVSMVWSVRQSRAQDVLSLLPAERRQRLPAMLARVAGERLGALRLNSDVHGFPLSVEQAEVIAPGIALVGDAAHRVHPLAGQGLNLGLGDVRELARVLANREPFHGAGDMQVLRRYRRARAEPVAAMRVVTDGLHKLFTLRAAPIALLRNAGLTWVDAVPALKRVLVEHACRS